ncbi:MAG: YqgE/AlgH family protein [Planctomycetota bacterium]|nr:YqgE/AlgH family protein [Planctomycetota bacterium]
MESLKGHLLVAPAYLADPNFSRAVVLMIQHDDDGAFGVILNRPTGRLISDVWRELRGSGCDCREQVHVGGPVAGPLVVLHTEPALAELPVVDGVYCSMSTEKIEELVSEDRKLVRIYAGYSGWGGGQLESELSTGSWLTTMADANAVFRTPDEELWARVTRAASGTDDLPRFDDGTDPALN